MSWAETIGVRFMVSDSLEHPAAAREATTATLARYVDELNGYFRNSEVALRAVLVDVDFVRIDSRDVMAILADMEHERGGFEAMFKQSSERGADYTFAVVDKLQIRGRPGCGRAYAVNKTIAEISSLRRAFAVINVQCGSHTLGHELGHLMGLNHGRLVDRCEPGQGHASAITPYANGYAEGNCDGLAQPGEFGDIMVGGWMRTINGNGKSSLPMYSNPKVGDERCGANRRCGDAREGDAARVLNENARHYASHTTQ